MPKYRILPPIRISDTQFHILQRLEQGFELIQNLLPSYKNVNNEIRLKHFETVHPVQASTLRHLLTKGLVRETKREGMLIFYNLTIKGRKYLHLDEENLYEV